MDAKTETADIEAAFNKFTTERKDIGILLINQHVRYPVSLNRGRSFRHLLDLWMEWKEIRYDEAEDEWNDEKNL